jgi:hypothetical protein
VIGHTAFDSVGQRYDGALITVDLKDAATEMLLLVRWRPPSRPAEASSPIPPGHDPHRLGAES